MKRFLPLLILLLIPGIVSAMPLEYYETVAKLNSTTTDFTFTFLFIEAPDGKLEYPLFFKINDFKTSANFMNYTCEASDESWGTMIYCDFSKASKEGRALSIKFTTSELVKSMDNRKIFMANVKTPENVKRMFVKAVLDKGFVLIEEPEKATTLMPYAPRDGKEGSDGRHIFVYWERLNVLKGEGLDFSVVYERVGPVVGSNNMIFLLIGVLFLIILLAVGLKAKFKPVYDINVLMPDERKIIEILKEHKGMCKQRVLVRETDFSKAKVSRLVKNLESRSLIKSEKVGRTNNIYLETPKTKE